MSAFRLGLLRAALLGAGVAFLQGSPGWCPYVANVLILSAFWVTDALSERRAKAAVIDGFQRLQTTLAGVRR